MREPQLAPDGTPLPILTEELKADPQYRLAESFNNFLSLNSTVQERQAAVHQCKLNSKENPFCFSILREKQWRKIQREREATPRYAKKEYVPITAEFKGEAVLNYKKLKKAGVKHLLAGMKEFSVVQLQALAQRALKDKTCPNDTAAATAASLESYLPNPQITSLIASLYEHGARCTRRNSSDKEHFLTRSALLFLLAKQPEKSEAILKNVRATDAYSGRSQYWLYRVSLALNKTDQAREALQRLQNKHPFSFHALISNPAGFQVSAAQQIDAQKPRSVKKPTVNVLIEQAELLKKFGFLDASATVVSWALMRFRPPETSVVLYLASLGGVDTQIRTATGALLTASQPSETLFKMAYPKAYFSLFNGLNNGIDPYLMLAIARKESTLNPKAVSVANAQGIMQLNPTTAAQYQPPGHSDLFDPQTNIKISALYLTKLMDEMNKNIPYVIAAYNAGEEPVMNWQKRYLTSDPILAMDLIPYRETRDYVGFVLTNYCWYRKLYENNLPNFLADLAQK